jgi:hypothetical protein
MLGSVDNSQCPSASFKSSGVGRESAQPPPMRSARPDNRLLGPLLSLSLQYVLQNAWTILVTGVFSSRVQVFGGLFGFIHSLGQERR